MSPPGAQQVAEEVGRALAEDLGEGDCTAALIPAERNLRTRVICRETSWRSGPTTYLYTFRNMMLARQTVSNRLAPWMKRSILNLLSVCISRIFTMSSTSATKRSICASSGVGWGGPAISASPER